MLKAVATKNGQVVATDELTPPVIPRKFSSTSTAARSRVADKISRSIKVTLVDKDGHVCPNADNEIKFSVDGTAATLAGVDNGDPTNHESFQGTQHKAFHGLALAVLEVTP